MNRHVTGAVLVMKPESADSPSTVSVNPSPYSPSGSHGRSHAEAALQAHNAATETAEIHGSHG